MSRTKLAPFTVEEDAKVLELVRKGKSWQEIASALTKRKARQVHERYINYLSPDLKTGAWTEEEDAQLVRLVKELGPLWSKIAERLPGRSQSAIKNRYINGHIGEEGGVRAQRRRLTGPAPRELAEAFVAKSEEAGETGRVEAATPSFDFTAVALEQWTFGVDGFMDWARDYPWRLNDGEF
jgi:hypothetical protein